MSTLSQKLALKMKAAKKFQFFILGQEGIPDYFARRRSPESVMHPMPMQCQAKLFVATVLQDLVHQPVSSLYGSSDPGLTQNAVEQTLQSTVRPLHEPASQPATPGQSQTEQPASQPASSQTASQPKVPGSTHPSPGQPQRILIHWNKLLENS